MNRRHVEVEIAQADADKFAVGEGLTVETAWRSGLDATARWIVDEVTHQDINGQTFSMVRLYRFTSQG